jgi:multiple antibiotic resistance protein
VQSVWTSIGVTFLALFPLTNPLGNLPIFAALTQDQPPERRHRQALLTACYVFLLLAVFAVAGRPLLHALGISLPALQIAGGLLVAHSGFGMVSGRPGLSAEERDRAGGQVDIAFSPMAMPLIAGPGALGAVIGIASRGTLGAEVGILLGVLVLSVVVFLVLRFGEDLVERMGPGGVGALGRIFGFLILAIGVELAVHGALALAPGLAH